MPIDVESNRDLKEPLVEQRSASQTPLSGSCGQAKFRLALIGSLVGIFFLTKMWVVPVPVELSVATLSSSTIPHSVGWHIKPIKPLHHGKVVYLSSEADDGSTVFTRTFTVPCAYGILVFNVGPAMNSLPFEYDIYEDAYAYSDNNGLCVLYPSYRGTQTSNKVLWEPQDPTQQYVELGDAQSKISSRVVIPNGSKSANTKRGGDFVIMRKGNFYNPDYYKQLKAFINGWPKSVDVGAMLEQFEFMEE